MQWFLWIIAILVSIAIGLWVYRADTRRSVPYPWLTAALRSIVVFLTLLLLLVPVITITRNKTQKPVIVFLQDNSYSIAAALNKDSSIYRKNAEELISKLSEKYRVVQWGFGNRAQTDSLYQYKQPATDISSVLSRVQDFYGTQNLGAVILSTDGRYNQGANPLYQSLSLRSPLYTVALGDSTMQKDLHITRTYANKTVSLNNEFEIRADIVASLCKGYNGNVVLQESGSTLASAPLSINADRYDRAVSFTIKADHAGLHHYIITAPVADGEKNTANNHKDVFVEVVDQKKNVLILCAAPHPDVNAIGEALSGLETYKITVRTVDNIPASFNDYQAVILDQLPSQSVALAQQLRAAKKPVWYILGNQSNVNALNGLQQLAVFAPAPPHDVLAGFNTAFTTFTLPQTTQAVMDKMPPLISPVANVKAVPSANVLFMQRQGTANEGQPVWMLGEGTVPVAILTGEGLWRWRIYEYKNFGQHNVVDECIRQTMSFLTTNSIEHPFRVELPKYVWSDQEAITLNAYLLNTNNEQINTPEAQLSIMDSSGHKQNYSFERSGNAYKLNIGVWAGGTYAYTAKTVYDGKPYTAAGSFVVESVPLELMETGADYPLLNSLAKKYHGSLVPGTNVQSLLDTIMHNQDINPIIQSDTESVPLVDWKWYFFLVLLFATVEWLLRKYWLAQ